MDNYEGRITYLIDNYKELLFSNPNIIGVGRGTKVINSHRTNIPTLTIHVSKKLLKGSISNNKLIPTMFYGAKTDVVESGDIKLCSWKFKPASGGDKIGVFEGEDYFTSTLGYLVTGNKNNKLYILTCAHCISDTDNKLVNEVFFQTRGSTDIIVIAKPRGVIPLFKVKLGSKFNKIYANEVDAGIAEVINTATIPASNIVKSGFVDGSYLADGISKVKIGDKVIRYGFAKGRVEENVIEVNCTLKIKTEDDNGTVKEVHFIDSIITNKRSLEGDSGAVGFMKENNKAFGLLFAGGGDESFYNPIDKVLGALDIRFVK